MVFHLLHLKKDMELKISELVHLLVTETLGYKNYLLQGGDWGSFISSRISHLYPKSILGLHLNF